jgi:uncharacterized protein
MSYLRFEWDKEKNKSNISKHGVSFEEAKSVFYDDFAKLISDPDHSNNEARFILMGMNQSLKLLVVVHVYKDNDNIIRIISARKATKNERKYYRGR